MESYGQKAGPAQVNNNNNSQELFESHQLLFDKIIQNLPASMELLTRIKLEYESVLEKIALSQSKAASRLLGEKVHATELGTLSNFRRRARELDYKLEKIRTENRRMQNEIERMRNRRKKLLADYDERLQFAKLKMSLESKSNTNVKRRSALGLSLSDATSLGFLQKHLLNVETKLTATQEVTEKKFVPVDKKSRLQDTLKEKEASRTLLATENKTLARMLKRLNVTIEAIHTYHPYLKEHKINPSTVSLEKYIRAVIASYPDLDEDDSDEDPEDPAKDLEAEMILDCHEKFNELFESEKYEEAALHAATSPKGVLRTLNTLLLFKTSARQKPGKKLPLLRYCEFLLECAPAFRPISLEESMEAASCILEQGEVNKLVHWIAQGCMPSSVDLGNLIHSSCLCSDYKVCKCGRKSLAFTVFDNCKTMSPAAICLIQQGKFIQFLSFAAKARFTKQDYVSLLRIAPSTDLAMLLVSPPEPHKPLLNIFELVDLLLKKKCVDAAIKYHQSYLEKLGLTLAQAVMKIDQVDDELIDSVISQLLQAGNNDLALDLMSSWTVKKAIKSSIHQLMQESQDHSSGSESYISDSAESGSATSSGEYSSDEEDSETD